MSMAETTEKPERDIESQKKLVEELRVSYKENSSDELKLKLDRETDLLQHLVNAEKGDAKNRAKKKAEFARLTLLNRAVRHSMPEE